MCSKDVHFVLQLATLDHVATSVQCFVFLWTDISGSNLSSHDIMEIPTSYNLEPYQLQLKSQQIVVDVQKVHLHPCYVPSNMPVGLVSKPVRHCFVNVSWI